MSSASRMSKNQMLINMFVAQIPDRVKQPLPVYPTVPSLDVRKLRARLMLEEVLETINEGLGLSVLIDGVHLPPIGFEVIAENLTFRDAKPVDLIQVADGCADVEVVTVGTASACGIVHQPCFELVMENNLLKFAPGHTIRADGKLVKRADHPNVEPKLRDELYRQGMEQEKAGWTPAPAVEGSILRDEFKPDKYPQTQY